MRRNYWLALAIIFTAGCSSDVAGLQSPGPRLVNPSFDEKQPGTPAFGWAQRGTEYGNASVVNEPVVSPTGALQMTAGRRNSMGDKSLMVFQVLDPTAFRGHRVKFGAQVKTDGGAVNITLYTPEKLANDFFQDLHSGGYVARSGTLDVPANASFLSFGIQVFGSNGARAWVDDTFVELEGAAGSGPTGRQPVARPDQDTTVAPGAGDASVRIDTTHLVRQISPALFGMHIEWADRGNGMLDASGNLRNDVLDALKPLRIPIFRFPGGIHADYYDWSGGVGRGDRRRDATNVFTRKSERSAFASPEFVDLLKALDAQALITANYGTGTPESAGAWARYLADAGAIAGYWEVGNEIYLADSKADQPNGRQIFRQPEQYAADFDRYRAAIRKEIPAAQVGAIAHIDSGAFPLAPAANRDWSARMLKALRGPADFIAIHNAYAPVIINDSANFKDETGRGRVYRAMYAAPLETAENLREMQALLSQSGIQQQLPFAITEFGPLFGVSRNVDVHTVYVDQSRTLAAAIYVASVLDVLIAAPRVSIATYTNPIHKWYGGLLTNTDHGLVKTPTYYLYSLYRNRFERNLVDASVTSPTFDATSIGIVKAHDRVPDMVVKAALSDDRRRLTIILVNRSLSRVLSTTVTAAGFRVSKADCQVLTARSPNAINGPALTSTSIGQQDIAPRPLTCGSGPDVKISIPPNAIVSFVAHDQSK